MATKLPALPELLMRKLSKTGQTRGADDDEIYQNRVSRCSTVLIPFPSWELHYSVSMATELFEKGYIVLLSPDQFFHDSEFDAKLEKHGLEVGSNSLIFYETREQWLRNDPDAMGWNVAESRNTPLGGKYVARISGTTSSKNGSKIARGFMTSKGKGAGIRVYEYASTELIKKCKLQLESLYWCCPDAIDVVVEAGMTQENAEIRKAKILCEAAELGLFEMDRLTKARIIDRGRNLICPLCLTMLSASGFLQRMKQAAGREVLDLTITELNLFHIEELKIGEMNHRPYNLGWGHHHCNVVVKDAGIVPTVEWMRSLVQRNDDSSRLSAS